MRGHTWREHSGAGALAQAAGQSHPGWASEGFCGERWSSPQSAGSTLREICHAHHLDDHHWVHRRCDRKVRHARRQRTIRIHSHNNSWDSRSFFSHLSRPSNRLVSRRRRRWFNWSSGRGDNYLGDLGIYCSPPSVSLATPISLWDFRLDLPGEVSTIAALGRRKVPLRRESALRRVFIDSVGEFAGQPREQLFPRQSCLFRQSF